MEINNNTSLCMQYKGNISLGFYINSEAFTSELIENLEEIFPCYNNSTSLKKKRGCMRNQLDTASLSYSFKLLGIVPLLRYKCETIIKYFHYLNSILICFAIKILFLERIFSLQKGSVQKSSQLWQNILIHLYKYLNIKQNSPSLQI